MWHKASGNAVENVPPQEGIFIAKLFNKEVYSHPYRDHIER